MRIAISMTSVCICSFRSRDQQDNYGRNSVSERGFGSSTGENRVLVAGCKERWYQGGHQDTIASHYILTNSLKFGELYSE